MTTSSLGVSNTHFVYSKINHASSNCISSFPCAIRAGLGSKAWKYSNINTSRNSQKALITCYAQSPLVTENDTACLRLETGEEPGSFSGPASQLIPSSDEVQFLLTEICDTTSIAEFELKVNGFHLHVKRAIPEGIATPPPSPSDSVSMSSNTSVETPLNGPVSPSLAITKASSLALSSGTWLERAADEGLVIIKSPKVGFFRRSRTIKGKRAPPASKEKQVVKEGQIICYIQQLGGELPVEADVSGEIIKILREDGEPVGYGDAIIAILPSFPGIKKLQLEG